MGYTVAPSPLPEVLVLEPEVFADERGFFQESFNQIDFARAAGIDVTFVQDNHSRSRRGVLRGLHYQQHPPQGKIVRVVTGTIWDVVVDTRRGSPTEGRWYGVELSANNHLQIWIPPGFAHGFIVLSDAADVLYKATTYYAPGEERCIAWNDPVLAIAWPLAGASPVLSAKDQRGRAFGDRDA